MPQNTFMLTIAGEKLAVKLHQLEQEKLRLEKDRSEEENKRQMKENACREEDLRLRAKEQELKQQEVIAIKYIACMLQIVIYNCCK
jgi:F-box protein 20